MRQDVENLRDVEARANQGETRKEMLSKRCIILGNAANFAQVSDFPSFRMVVFQSKFCKSYKGSPASEVKMLATKMQERILPQVFNPLLA